MAAPTPVPVRSITASLEGGVHRVTADVGGDPVWFESRELPLRAAPEGFASALLLPVLSRHGVLTLEQPLDPAWNANMARALETFHRWWRVPRRLPEAPAANGAGTSAAPAVRQTALFFSGGTDSFYSLLRAPERIDWIVTLHGFDYDLDERERLAATEALVRDVAAARGVRAAFVATNVRRHPLVRSAKWERVHGGILTGVGHLMADTVDRVLISSSISRHIDRDWGSHPDTDPLWSSSRVTFASFGHDAQGLDLRRIDKLRALVDEPLVRRHLRVCWDTAAASGNCSRCPKCVFTRSVLAESGVLPFFPGFEPEATLVRSLDGLRYLKSRMRAFSDLQVSPRLDPEVRRAIRDLLARTKREKGWPMRLRRAIGERVFGPGGRTRP